MTDADRISTAWLRSPPDPICAAAADELDRLRAATDPEMMALNLHPEFRRGLDVAAASHAQTDREQREIMAGLRVELEALRGMTGGEA